MLARAGSSYRNPKPPKKMMLCDVEVPAVLGERAQVKVWGDLVQLSALS